MNQQTNNWQNNILKALENSGFTSADLVKYQALNDSGARFMEEIAFQRNMYEYLNNLGLVNTGICPITGKPIQVNYQYSMFGRVIYLSKEGSEICEEVRRSESKARGFDYDKIKKEKQQGKTNSKIITFVLIIISFVGSYYIIHPTGFWSYILFFIVGFITLKLLTFIMLAFILPKFYRSTYKPK